MGWIEVATVERLAGAPVVLKRPPKQVAVFLVGERTYAIDNRCPHEGYPLAQGSIDGEHVLTCNWHNWKFRLMDGHCVLGGDHVRAYPTKEEDGRVWVDLADPPPEEVRRTVLAGLRTAFEERDYGRICRELTRLHMSGLDPLDAVAEAVAWTHDRLEFGTTHAFAAAADWLGLAERHARDWERRLVSLAEPIDHMAFDALRQPTFAYAEAGLPFDAQRFLAAVEGERREEVEGCVRRGLADGLGWADLEPAFAAAALAHYNDFGHSLIYVQKTGELLERTGARLEPFVLPALARHLAYTTREDRLPEFADYTAALARLPEPLPGGRGARGARPASPFPATLREVFAWLADVLATHALEAVFDALLEALARNLLAFDESFASASDLPVQQSVGWLDFTHALTFADAVHALSARHPDLWRPGLLQLACFLGRNRPFLALAADEGSWAVADETAFIAGVHERLLDHGFRDPIFSAHLIKTTVAVERRIVRASPSCRRALLAALHRFTSSPIKQKHTRRLARQAIELVRRDFEPA
jgi:nitrite reductase/ring-hydroxylating ferredoxin subunit